MIDRAISLVAGRLNAHLRARFGIADDIVAVSGLTDAEGKTPAGVRNRLALFVTNITHDTMSRGVLGRPPIVAGRAPVNPMPVHLNVHVMLASSFDPEVWRDQWPDDPEYGEAVIAVMQGTLEQGVPDLQIPGQDEYVKVADAEISAALTGAKSAQQALDDAAAEWNNITDRLGREQQLALWIQQLRGLQERGIDYRPELAESAS